MGYKQVAALWHIITRFSSRPFDKATLLFHVFLGNSYITLWMFSVLSRSQGFLFIYNIKALIEY